MMINDVYGKRNFKKTFKIKVSKKSRIKSMEYRNLGNSGLKVSAISLGTWLNCKDLDTYKEIIQTAYLSGINFFDTAESYDCGTVEKTLGLALKELNIPRENLVISTKLYFGSREKIYEENNPFLSNSKGSSRKHVLEGMSSSLKRLQLDYVDIVFSHRFDEETPMEEICRGFNDLIEKGLTFYWGTSEWPAHRIAQANELCIKFGLISPISEQAQYNILVRDRVENEYLSLFNSSKMGLTVWSPLCGGVLTGKYLQDIPKESRMGNKNIPFYVHQRFEKYFSSESVKNKRIEQFEKFEIICKELKCTFSQLALAWVLYNKSVSTAIIGASSKEQIVENCAAVVVLRKLNKEIIQRVETIFKD